MKCIFIGFLTFIGSVTAFADTKLNATPGTMSEIDWPGTERGSITIHVPKDYAPRSKFPLLFWFHGQGGRPSTGIVRQVDNGNGWIVVGMSYAKLTRISRIREYADKNWKLCQDIRRHLKKTLSVGERSYVGGFSRGANTAYMIAHVAPKDLSGAVILGGGKFPAFVAPAGTYRKPASILIGCGNLDINYPLARNAAEQLHRNRAHVVFAEWHNVGHQPTVDDTVQDWFRSMRDLDNKSWREQSQSFIDETLKTSDESDWIRFQQLEQALKSPKFLLATATQRRKIERELLSLRRSAEVVTNTKSRKAFDDLLAQEAKLMQLDKPSTKALEKLAEKFLQHEQTHANSEHAAKATAAAKRIESRIRFNRAN